MLVMFVDETGTIVRKDAREMLGVKELDTVVVQGKARRDKAGNVVILASKLYVHTDGKRSHDDSRSRHPAIGHRPRRRGGAEGPRRRHVVSRYVVPGTLLVGFLSLVAWASRDTLLPPQPVWVVPVFATHSTVQHEGTPLFQAAGWIEPRPTPVRVAALAPGVVERLLVVQDQLVKAGEPVAELIREDAQLAHDRALASLQLRQAELREMQAEFQAASTRFSQPVHLEAALGEAEAALAEITTELKNLPFETRRAEAQLDFAKRNYDGKQASAGAVAGRVVNRSQEHGGRGSGHGGGIAQPRRFARECSKRPCSSAAMHSRRNSRCWPTKRRPKMRREPS